MTTELPPRMATRLPAQSVIAELLRQHSASPKRTAFGRFFGFSPLDAATAPWYRGALGEIAIGRVLATLPPEWTTFHALPFGTQGADIDHLVIGPGGIFTINTKNHSGKAVWVGGGTLMVSGQKQPHIRNAEFEAARVTTLLQQRMPRLPDAQPVVAVHAPKSLTIRTPPKTVRVVASTGLRRWLLKRPHQIDPPDLLQLAALIEKPDTWPPLQADTAQDWIASFAALDLEVRAARRLSILWRLLATVSFVVSVLGARRVMLAAMLGI